MTASCWVAVDLGVRSGPQGGHAAVSCAFCFSLFFLVKQVIVLLFLGGCCVLCEAPNQPLLSLLMSPLVSG